MPAEFSPLAMFIRKERKKRQWSQEELARYAGISDGTISLIERDKVRPETATVEAIAEALGFERRYLLDMLAASVPSDMPRRDIDPKVMGIAERINALPPAIRDALLRSVRVQLDAFADVAELEAAYAQVIAERPDLFEDAPDDHSDDAGGDTAPHQGE